MKQLPDHAHIIANYIEAFKLANPGKDLPIIEERDSVGGWVYINGLAHRYREIPAFTDRLLKRASHG